jgi:hypothetical protein
MKFAEVALKQIAKPVSKQLLDGALAYPQVTKFCVTIGQTLHYVNVRVTRSAEGQSNSRRIFELPEEKAKDAGALFLGEVIVFSLTGLIIAWQYYVTSKASTEAAEAEERNSQLRAAEKHAELLQRDMRLAQLEQSVVNLWKVLDNIQTQQPHVYKSVAIESSKSTPPLPVSKPGSDPLTPKVTGAIASQSIDVIEQLMKTSMSTEFRV